MKYGLTRETITKINILFENFNEIDEAIIFGSRAMGNHKPGSDIDITLKGKNLNLKITNKICLNLDDLFLPYIFDISIYHQIDNMDLIEHIERVGKVFYQKSTNHSKQSSILPVK